MGSIFCPSRLILIWYTCAPKGYCDHSLTQYPGATDYSTRGTDSACARLLPADCRHALHRYSACQRLRFLPEIYRKGRYSSDADLLVRPSHVDRFVEILLADGWRIQAHFETGSVFEHAITLYHASWGLTDIHRFFPGLGRHGDYEKAFERVWAARKTRMIAHRPCTIPSDLDARLLVVLHRARAASRYSADINYLVSALL